MSEDILDWFYQGIDQEVNQEEIRLVVESKKPLNGKVISIDKDSITVGLNTEGFAQSIEVKNDVYPYLKIGDPIIVWLTQGYPELVNPNWTYQQKDQVITYGQVLPIQIETVNQQGAAGFYMNIPCFIPASQLPDQYRVFEDPYTEPKSKLVGCEIRGHFIGVQDGSLIFSSKIEPYKYTLYQKKAIYEIKDWSNESVEYNKLLFALRDLSTG